MRVPSRTALSIAVLLAAAACAGADPAIVDLGARAHLTEPAATNGPPPPSPSTSSTTIAPETNATTSTSTPGTTAPLSGLRYEILAEGLTHPVFLTAPAGDARLFVLEKTGRILIFDQEGAARSEPFLDIRDKVESDVIEQGLLGMAFHPEYDTNGRFFVYYTDVAGDSTIAEYSVSDDPDVADEAGERIVLVVEQPDIRHNAGMLQFGPDGYLYIALGDGGAGASRNSQDPSTLLGSILRIDVDGEPPYAIPPDNPFVDGGGAPEVFHYGLRNPWRFAIDPVEEMLYIGDVGQAVWEEIDVVPLDDAGQNFGWHLAEGLGCFGDEDCDPSDFTEPVIAYTHAEDGCSVTGGYVYRGTQIPELVGHYIYTDWCQGWIRTFRYTDGEVTQEQDWSEDLGGLTQIDSFGVDGFGELYVTTFEGVVARIEPAR